MSPSHLDARSAAAASRQTQDCSRESRDRIGHNWQPDARHPEAMHFLQEQNAQAARCELHKTAELDGGKTDPEPDMDSGRATVRNVRSKCRCSCVLQFTLRRAVSCVLHRPSSQVIHCIEFCKVFRKLTSFCTCNLSKSSQFYSALAGVGAPNPGQALARPRATGRSRAPRQQLLPARGVSARDRRVERAQSQGSQPQKNSQLGRKTRNLSAIKVLASKKHARCTRSGKSLMILPQVHLRKPCYDFYFL